MVFGFRWLHYSSVHETVAENSTSMPGYIRNIIYHNKQTRDITLLASIKPSFILTMTSEIKIICQNKIMNNEGNNPNIINASCNYPFVIYLIVHCRSQCVVSTLLLTQPAWEEHLRSRTFFGLVVCTIHGQNKAFEKCLKLCLVALYFLHLLSWQGFRCSFPKKEG